MLKLKKIIFSVVTAIVTISLYCLIHPEYMRWPAIFGYMIISIMLVESFLKEEPMELFCYFSIENWKKAKISSILMIIAAISFVKALISLVVILLNR